MAVIQDKRHKKELVLRLKRVEGQLRGIQAMIEKDADCERVTQQLSAARRALDKAFFQVLACALQAAPQEPGARKAASGERIAQAAELLARYG
ncbi:MAG: metal-sensing transcriptional repressor [Betaproteobacteria bacterium]|nr:metal-sensing transcriptional repressor [Betaproteobacteria bacterium]